jgi:YceI-like protein
MNAPQFDFSQSECFVYVYREGVLSSAGHDLQLRVMAFNMEGGEEPLSVRAVCRADSLRVTGAVNDGVVDANALSSQDKQKIERIIREDVLEASKYPTISFRSTDIEKVNARQYWVTGLLDLHGVSKEVSFVAGQKADAIIATMSLHQPDFRVVPYRAFLGTLRVKPDVQIKVSLPGRDAGQA